MILSLYIYLKFSKQWFILSDVLMFSVPDEFFAKIRERRDHPRKKKKKEPTKILNPRCQSFISGILNPKVC